MMDFSCCFRLQWFFICFLLLATSSPCLAETEAATSPPSLSGGSEETAPATDAASRSFQKLEKQMELLESEVKRLKDEADARRQLESTEEEKNAQEEEILSAAGREYTLMRPGRVGVEYNLSYAYYSYDTLVDAQTIEHKSNHNLNNSVFIEYPLKENITLNFDLPFVYKYDNRSSDGSSRQVSDLGDPVFGCQYQPMKTGGIWPTTIFSGRLTVPMGRSPYEIDPLAEMSTGGGLYTLSLGANVSKTIDPIIAYGGLTYTYRFEEDGLRYHARGKADPRYIETVEAGDQFGFSMGFGYALSYLMNLNVSYQYSLRMKTRYTWNDGSANESATSASSVLSIGTGWRISTKRSINLNFGFGLTNDDPDVTLSVRVPFTFKL